MGLFSKAGPRLAAILGLGLLPLAMACGAAATATPAPAKAPQPAAAQPPAPAAPVAAQPTAPTAPAATPTATPVPTVAPPALAVNPGKVTWMVSNFGNERFDYTLSFSGGAQNYANVIHAFLISSDVKEGMRVLAPGIATRWEISRDGLTWNLTIQKGANFHDGKEVTAEDVLWTLRHIIGPQAGDYGGSTSGTWGRIMDRIEQTGPDRVSLTTKVPATDFPALVSEATGVWVGVVLPKRATLHDVNEEAAYDRNPIGAGLMRLVKHVPVAQMTFERFADYYHQPKNGFPTSKRVNFALLDLRLVPEEATRVAAVRAGEADIAPVSLATKKQIEAGGGRLVFGQEGSYFRIPLMGCWKPQFPCRDQRVRQALAYAINKEVMRDRLYGGPEVMQLKGWFAVTPSTIGYSPELDPFPFDPAKARQLLADAGYPGGKGFGKLVVNTYVSPTGPLMPESAQLAADFWKRELGLDVEVKVGDESAVKKATSTTEDFHGQILWRDDETRIDAGSILRSFYGDPEKKDRAHNDPALFDLTRKALAVVDPVEREKVLISTYRRSRDEAYQIAIGYINIPWGVGPRIATWEPYPLANYPSALHTITLK